MSGEKLSSPDQELRNPCCTTNVGRVGRWGAEGEPGYGRGVIWWTGGCSASGPRERVMLLFFRGGKLSFLLGMIPRLIGKPHCEKPTDEVCPSVRYRVTRASGTNAVVRKGVKRACTPIR